MGRGKTNENLFSILLNTLGVRHTRKFTRETYARHPNKYNMLGLSKMLSDYAIPNEGVMLGDPADVALVEPPFIAQFSGDMYVVDKITDSEAHLWGTGGGVKVPLDKFKEGCTGAVLVAEPDEHSIEPGFRANRRRELFERFVTWGLIAAALAAVAWGVVANEIYLHPGLLVGLALNLVGVYVCLLLVLRQVHFSSRAAEVICSMFNTRRGCNNVLESPAAKLFGLVGWSELGLGYFISNTLLLVFAPWLVPWSALLGTCALGYTLWSVWYQRFVAGEWCPLCLIIQSLFVALFVCWLLSGFLVWPVLAAADFVTVALIYAVPTLAILALLPIVTRSLIVDNITYDLNHIRMSEDVFGALLAKQPAYEVDREASAVVFGNPQAETLITVVSNPHCNPCSRIHPKIDNLLHHAGERVCVQFFFLNFDKDETRESGKFLISTCIDRGAAAAQELFADWFDKGRNATEETYREYGFDPASPSAAASKEQQRHLDWCDRNKIAATPTILVNGYRLPAEYAIDDLSNWM